jgi:hypothetical protein
MPIELRRKMIHVRTADELKTQAAQQADAEAVAELQKSEDTREKNWRARARSHTERY